MRTVTGLAWRIALFAVEIRSATSLHCAAKLRAVSRSPPRRFSREIAEASITNPEGAVRAALVHGSRSEHDRCFEAGITRCGR